MSLPVRTRAHRRTRAGVAWALGVTFLGGCGSLLGADFSAVIVVAKDGAAYFGIDGTMQASGGDVGNARDLDAAARDAAHAGMLGLRVDQARLTSTSPLQLNVMLSNRIAGYVLSTDGAVFSLKTTDGKLFPVRALRALPAWVDGTAVESGLKLLPEASVQWNLEVPGVTLASRFVPEALIMEVPDGHTAQAAVTLEACTVCGATCTYTDRDVSHCGSCSISAEEPSKASCKAGVLFCNNAEYTLCSQGTSRATVCVDLQTSDQHCGACGVAVKPASGVCVSGQPKVWGGAPTPTPWPTHDFAGAWGSSKNDVWFASKDGSMLRYRTARGFEWFSSASSYGAYSISGTSADRVWASGGAGRLRRWNGGAWQTLDLGSVAWLYGIHCLTETDMWTVGGDEAWRCNSTACGQTTTPAGTNLNAVWGIASNDVWAVGAMRNTVLHWNGFDWSSVATPTLLNVAGIWGIASNDVWAVGGVGLAMHWNGTAWRTVPTPVKNSAYLYGVWGSSSNDVWAVGMGGTIIHWNGKAWSNVRSPIAADFNGVWGATRDDVWVVGKSGAILHLDPSL